MDRFTKKVYKKIERDLVNKIGVTNANFVLDKFGRGQSFLNTICLLPKWFSDSFLNNTKKYNLNILGEANLKAWIGYTLYDYIRDGKIPKEKLVRTLSVANMYTNEALSIFINQADSKFKNNEILKLFNKIDLFYIKQETIFNFDNFKHFSSMVHEKSIAAAISAILVIPNPVYKKSLKNSLDFFKFYFTARQLSDDLDDYKKDLKTKNNTPVILMIKNGLSINELNLFIQKEIDLNFNKCIKSLKTIQGFDSESFIKKYVKAC